MDPRIDAGVIAAVSAWAVAVVGLAGVGVWHSRSTRAQARAEAAHAKLARLVEDAGDEGRQGMPSDD